MKAVLVVLVLSGSCGGDEDDLGSSMAGWRVFMTIGARVSGGSKGAGGGTST